MIAGGSGSAPSMSYLLAIRVGLGRFAAVRATADLAIAVAAASEHAGWATVALRTRMDEITCMHSFVGFSSASLKFVSLASVNVR